MAAKNRRFFVPAPLYEALPMLYTATGLSATVGAVHQHSTLMFLCGGALILIALLIIEMRATYRGCYAFVQRGGHGS
jgi:hypothetical protein